METQTSPVADLKNLLTKLKPQDREFALSLIRGWEKYKKLSDKQVYWVEVLCERATGAADKPAAPVSQVGDFQGVLKLFAKARQHLKYPKIHLQVGEQPLCLSVAGEYSKAPGTVNVTDGQPFGQNKWFGRVDPKGSWTQGHQATDEIKDFLVKFGQNPAKTAKEYGRLTGRCCFCNSGLTDERSTAAGFGPTCAKNYGLEAEWKAGQSVLDTVAKAIDGAEKQMASKQYQAEYLKQTQGW